ncbi:MAG TPA: hypothetical protein VFW55_11485, partial [Propionicimonas sp.]|nr:hypothetical protein [Propionicimonas sp.]
MRGRVRRILSGVRGRLAPAVAGKFAARVAALATGVDGPVVLLLDGGSVAAVRGWLNAFGANRVHVLAESRRTFLGVRWLEVSGRREIEDHLALIGTAPSSSTRWQRTRSS